MIIKAYLPTPEKDLTLVDIDKFLDYIANALATDEPVNVVGSAIRAARVDAAPVVHAHWEHIIEHKPTWDKYLGKHFIDTPKVMCSNCKKTNKDYESPYCPHCGAVMAEEV